MPVAGTTLTVSQNGNVSVNIGDHFTERLTPFGSEKLALNASAREFDKVMPMKGRITGVEAGVVRMPGDAIDVSGEKKRAVAVAVTYSPSMASGGGWAWKGPTGA